MALAVAMLPGVLISGLHRGSGILFIFLGLSVALVFCALAYRRHVP